MIRTLDRAEAEIARLNRRITDLEGELAEWLRRDGEAVRDGAARHRLAAARAWFDLTPNQAALLLYLCDRAPGVFPAWRLLDCHWGLGEETEPKVIDVMVCKIRAKLKSQGLFGVIVTHWRLGYSVPRERAAVILGSLQTALAA